MARMNIEQYQTSIHGPARDAVCSDVARATVAAKPPTTEATPQATTDGLLCARVDRFPRPRPNLVAAPDCTDPCQVCDRSQPQRFCSQSFCPFNLGTFMRRVDHQKVHYERRHGLQEQMSVSSAKKTAGIAAQQAAQRNSRPNQLLPRLWRQGGPRTNGISSTVQQMQNCNC